MQFPKDFVETDGVYQPIDLKDAIAYTDGATAERYLDSVLGTVADVSSLSTELRDTIRDWPSRYHLSAERSNLLRCIDLDESSRVLEIGAGCGALTRYLGENTREVVAVEGSPARARLCRKRCRDLANVTIIAGDVFKLCLEDKFDVVTLIGVLEYAGVFRQDEPNPFRAMLALAEAWLRPGGQLVLAIENQFGIKYFSGCGEDHGEPPFSGLEGYPEGTGVRTFGRTELLALLRDAGLPSSTFLLPFPDYKIPNSFVNAAYAHPEGARHFGLADWCRKPFEDYAIDRRYLFDDHLALAELARNGLLADHANSFLIVATKPGGPDNGRHPIGDTKWIAQRYNVTRHPAFSTKTTLRLENALPIIEKERLGPAADDAAYAACKVRHVLETDPFVQGAETMAMAMLRALRKRRGAEEAFASLLAEWVGFFRPEDAMPGSTTLLRGEFIDCIPDNLLRTGDNRWTYIDREWRWNEPVSLDWVFYRGLVSFWCHHRLAIAGHDSRHFGGLERFLARCFKLLGSPTSPGEFEALRRQEDEFQAIVRHGPSVTVVLNKGRMLEPEIRDWKIPGRTSV